MRDDSDNRWHLDKRVQISHIIATLVVAASAIAYLRGLEQRLVILETDARHARERSVEQDAALRRITEALDRRLNRIEDKIDALGATRQGGGR